MLANWKMHIHFPCFVADVSMLRDLFLHKDTKCSLVVWVACGRQNSCSLPMMVASIYHIQYHFYSIVYATRNDLYQPKCRVCCIAHMVRNVSGKDCLDRAHTSCHTSVWINLISILLGLIDGSTGTRWSIQVRCDLPSLFVTVSYVSPLPLII